MPSTISKKQLFTDKAIRRIVTNLVTDDQLEFNTYLWLLRMSYFQILIKSPAEFMRVLGELLRESPVSTILDVLRFGGWDLKLAKKTGVGSITKP